jgi:hypothetical protein
VTVHVFGIRHHGPGSARSLRQALEALQPDCILIEGPPEADEILSLVAHEEMRPPVALLIYAPDVPGKAVYYPFTVFSPEWQAMSIGVQRSVPVRFMDLPQTHWLAMKEGSEEEEPAGETASDDRDTVNQLPQNPEETGSEKPDHDPADSAPGFDVDVRNDPLSLLAQAAGYSDGERWWEHMVEHRRDSVDLFKAILEAMSAVRKEAPARDDKMEPYREAHMRNMIRAAEKDGHKNIAVVCGAWHAPSLVEMPSAKEDAATLKGLPKVKVSSTWIPWTHSRLSYASGYGAGVDSPGWYHHLWTCQDLIVERWMTLVARLLRAEDLDASSAHIIEAVRLAESLAALRGRPLPGLAELTEATQAVLCFGNEIPLRLIHDKLIVGEVLGTVPETVPSVPLQLDLQREQKRLRMPADAGDKVYDLDLRKENDLDRSRLLHRLNLLQIPWGREQKASGASGTFHEIWQVRWMPEFSLRLIEAGKWGRTVPEAANAYACEMAMGASELPELTNLLDKVLLADISTAVEFVMDRIKNVAAVAGDITHLMDALPPLVRVARYGNVRKTDVQSVERIIEALMVRVCISLPGACSSLNDDAAQPMFERINAVHNAVLLLQIEDNTRSWLETMTKLADAHGIHGLLAGRACRLLLEQRTIDTDEAARRFGLALSIASGPNEAASWAEGFLRGSGLILIHDEALWSVVDDWTCSLNADQFTEILPLLRRTFSTFESAERRQMGERVAKGVRRVTHSKNAANLDEVRADLVVPVMAQLLGLEE